MKDFGNLNAEWTTCTVCGSRNHESADHHKLNDAAPELREALLGIMTNQSSEIPERYLDAAIRALKITGDFQ